MRDRPFGTVMPQVSGADLELRKASGGVLVLAVDNHDSWVSGIGDERWELDVCDPGV